MPAYEIDPYSPVLPTALTPHDDLMLHQDQHQNFASPNAKDFILTIATLGGSDGDPGGGGGGGDDDNEVDPVIVTSGGGGGGGDDGDTGTGDDGGGGGGGNYGDDGRDPVEVAADTYASTHIDSGNLDLNNPVHKKWYIEVHDALKQSYMAAHLNGYAINGPGSYDMTNQEFMDMLDRLHIHMTSDSGRAGETLPRNYGSNTEYDVYFRVNDAEGRKSEFGSEEKFSNYLIFHELGHANAETMNFGKLHGYDNDPNTPPMTQADRDAMEAFANTMGRGLADALGVIYPGNSELAGYGGTMPQ